MSVDNTPIASRRRRKPLLRRLLKLVLAGVPGWSHAHDWLPRLRLVRDGAGRFTSVLFRGAHVCALEPTSILKNTAAASGLFIVGSGPSVAYASFETMPDFSAILLNGACTLIGDAIQHPLAIAIEDERFIWRHMPLLLEKVAPGTIALLSVGVLRAICEIDAQWLSSLRVILIDDIRKPYGRARRSLTELKRLPGAILDHEDDAGFSTKPDKGVFQGGSVAISAIQFAACCSPKTIGLIGIDISNADQPRFYETAGDTASSGIRRSQTRIVRHVALARDVCRERGTGLQSLSPISLLNPILQTE